MTTHHIQIQNMNTTDYHDNTSHTDSKYKYNRLPWQHIPYKGYGT